MSGAAILVLCVLLSTGASYFLKLGAMGAAPGVLGFVMNPMIWLGGLCYAATFAGYAIVLQKVPLSLAQPVITAGVSVLTAVLSVVFLKEVMSSANWAGLLLVCAGIYLLFLGKI
jgi:multidrug transporter EmrE-like cation transporter